MESQSRPISDSPDEEDTDLRELLQLSLLPGLGPRLLARLLERFETAGAVLKASPEQLQQVSGVGEKLIRTVSSAGDYVDVEDVIAWCRAHEVAVWVRGRPCYPESFEVLPDPPPVLFARGRWLPRDNVAAAIVGTRHATPYGLAQTRRLAMDLAAAGVTIVSGLARGIDTAAHRGALEADGRTVAVLGGGLGQMYPAENQGLADQIAAGGAVLSEYAPMAKSRSGMFPQRNRLIAALGLATIVVEAAERSGAQITARLAAEIGRDVGAVPGSVQNRASRGCHDLIRDGATLVRHAGDVLEMLGPMSESEGCETGSGDQAAPVRQGRELTLNEVERRVLEAVATDPTAIDEVTARCGLPVARVSAVLSILEVKRFVRKLSSQYVARL